MKYQLQVYRAKPNPAGKDRSRQGVKPEQLVAEWVDVKNIGVGSMPFNLMELYNTTFGSTCTVTGSKMYWTDRASQYSLAPGQILRVHTGSKSYENTLSAADRGTDITWRAFAESANFVLNNDCGDKISILWKDEQSKAWYDAAHYEPKPLEGVVLHRIGDKLKPFGLY